MAGKVNQRLNELHWIPDSVASIAAGDDTLRGRASRDGESRPPFRGRAARRSSCSDRPKLEKNAKQYVVNIALIFGDHDDAEQAEMQLATTVFNGMLGSWSEVEEVR